MKRLGKIIYEFLTISLWAGLAIAGFETAMAAGSMPHEMTSPLRWIHFVLYALGGFILMAMVFQIPGLLITLIYSIFKKDWSDLAIRKFLLAFGATFALILGMVLLSPHMLKLFFVSVGWGLQSWLMLVALLFVAFLIGTVFSTGIVSLLEKRGNNGTWSLVWGWWLFTITVPAVGIALSWIQGMPSVVVSILMLVIAVAAFLVLKIYLPRFYNFMQTGGTKRWAVASIVILIVYFATTPWPREIIRGEPADAAHPPLILITIDTLRPDTLDCYPEQDSLRMGTPNIGRIADEGVVFENYWACAPWTVPSVGSMLSGLPPDAHGAADDESSVLAPGCTTIAEILKENGYTTGGVVVNYLLSPGTGMEQGFDYYDETYLIHQNSRRLLFQRLIDRIRLYWPDVFAPSINNYLERDAIARSREYIREHAGERFFLWIHLFAPHMPWFPPGEYRTRAEEVFDTEVVLRDVSRQNNMKSGMTYVTQEVLHQARALYAAEVTFTDDNVGEIIEEMEIQDIMDGSVMVITADHGEEFYDHDRVAHAHTLYPELLHIPLIVRYPAVVPEGARIDEDVSMINLAPSILDLLGVEPALDNQPAEFFGRSFAPLIFNEEVTDLPVFFETPLLFDRNQKGVLYNGYYYLSGDNQVLYPRLYDLTIDPLARYDILPEHPEVVDELEAYLREFIELSDTIAERVGAGQDAGMTEKLRSLGYLN